MSEALKTIRLKPASVEFNLSMEHIVEFLKKKGITVENNPNTKLPGEAYAMLQSEFASDKSIREEAHKVTLGKIKPEEDRKSTRLNSSHRT